MGRFLPLANRLAESLFTSWSVYPYMTNCWKFIYEEALSGLRHRPHFFFDLADPASRSAADLSDMIDSLKGFEKIGRVTLSVNGSEANQIAHALGLEEAANDALSLERMANEIRAKAGISEASIHLVKCATTATTDSTVTVDGPYCAKPKLSVGAGDRFNAGLLAGLLLGLDPVERLSLGCASSGYFVRNAKSATWSQIIPFLRIWAADTFSEQ